MKELFSFSFLRNVFRLGPFEVKGPPASSNIWGAIFIRVDIRLHGELPLQMLWMRMSICPSSPSTVATDGRSKLHLLCHANVLPKITITGEPLSSIRQSQQLIACNVRHFS